MITAAMIDSREPAWVQKLTFEGAATAVVELPAGDVHAYIDDGTLLVVERKTPDDLLNTLREERLFPQITRLAEMREAGAWPYLVITGELRRDAAGKVTTASRETSWSWDALQGALLTVQEMGVFVVQCAGDYEFEACILRLARRSREATIKVLPARLAILGGAGEAFLSSLPGIGIENLKKIWEWSGGLPGHALAGLTDLQINAPVGMGTRRKIRGMLGLKDKQRLDVLITERGDEALVIMEEVRHV